MQQALHLLSVSTTVSATVSTTATATATVTVTVTVTAILALIRRPVFIGNKRSCSRLVSAIATTILYNIYLYCVLLVQTMAINLNLKEVNDTKSM